MEVAWTQVEAATTGGDAEPLTHQATDSLAGTACAAVTGGSAEEGPEEPKKKKKKRSGGKQDKHTFWDKLTSYKLKKGGA